MRNNLTPQTRKSGPGRQHVEGASKARYPVAQFGGNWQGVEYNSLREEDRITILRLRHGITYDEALAMVRQERPSKEYAE